MLAEQQPERPSPIVGLIRESVDKVKDGQNLVNESGVALAEIVTSVAEVSDIMSEISAASAEQARGIDHIGIAITNMDDGTQANSAMVEQAASASEALGESADDMSALISFFHVEGGVD